MNTEDRIAMVAATWTPKQGRHPGNIAWHGSGCDGAPPPDATIDALGWLDETSGSVLFEPVGTVPEHARQGLSRAVCQAVMNVARGLGASLAVVGPRGDAAYPVPRRLYASLGFETLARTEVLTWG